MAAKFEVYEDAGGKFPLATQGGEWSDNRIER